MTTRKEIVSYVKRQIKDGVFPEYQTQDDNGLSPDEYVDLIEAALRALSPTEDQPIAWMYDLAFAFDNSRGEYSDWRARLSFVHPNVPAASIRNVRPLFRAMSPQDVAVTQDKRGNDT